ncbi:MAG: tyrosine-type recombinase/integrase [Burkholderiales bacterium]|nr:tyrosine-type recombinase/integrase [Burkholderiales bacterium]
MADTGGNKLRELLIEAKGKLRLDDERERHRDELADLHREQQKELARVRLEAENEVLKRAMAGGMVAAMPTPSFVSEIVSECREVPSPAVLKPSSGLHRLSEAITEWKRLKNPALSTVEIYESAVRRFEGYFPGLHAETIEKRHVREYVKWLQDAGKSAKTIEKEHGAIRALLTIAEHEEWREGNPASGVMLPADEKKKRRSYTPDECKAIFGSPVFASGERPVAGKGEAAYWIPLLLLFTGARREEIGQLSTDRIKTYEGISYLVLDPIDDEGRLKTEESKRAVPIHAELLRIGFLDYVAERVKAGGGMLFPLLRANERGQYCAKWGDWWRRYVRDKIGISDVRIGPSHSFRHLFITECRRLEIREDYERALVGHVRGGRKDAHDDYGEHLVPSLAAVVNRIDFRGLDLSHLHPA